MNGITQFIRLALDRAQAAKAEEELKQSLKRGTDPKAAEQNIGRIEKRFDSLVSMAKKGAAAMAGFFAVRQVASFAGEMFRVGTAAEETGSKFTTTFGAASKQVQSFIDDWARLAGLNQTVGQEMTATAGAIVQGMGMSREASAAFSERMLRLAGDMQSFHNVPIGETFTAIKAGLVGSWEPLDRFGIVLRQTDVDTRALTETGKSSAAALTQQEKAVAALSLMYERAGPALGDLERTQDSTANRARALQADFENLKIQVATELMPAFERLVGYVSDNRDQFGKLGEAAVSFITIAGPHVAKFFNDLGTEIKLVNDEIARLVRSWEAWQSITGKFYGNEKTLNERERIGYMRPTGRNEDMRSDNERQRDLERGVRGTASPSPTANPAAPGGENAAQRKARLDADKKAARERIAADKKAARERASAAKKAAKEASKDAEEEQQRAWRVQAGFQNELAGRGGDRMELPGISRRPKAMAFVASYEKEQAAILQTAQVWRDAHADMENATQSVAMGIMDSFGSAIEMMVTGAGTIGDAFTGLGAGIAADILGGIKQLAMGKVAEEIAWAYSSFARGDVPSGTAALLAAAKWTAAGGVAAGLGGAMGGIGRGGSAHRGGGIYGREAAGNTQPHNVTYVYIDPFNPKNPVHSRQIGKAVDLHVELAGRPAWAR